MVALIAYYTLISYGSFFILSVLPCLLKPWEMGVKMYMPLKLPTDPRTIKQLTYMQAFLGAVMLTFSTTFLIGAYVMFCKTFVAALLAIWIVGLLLFVPIFLERDTIGIDLMAMGMQLSMQLIVCVLLTYSLLFEDYEEIEEIHVHPKINRMFGGIGGFWIFANFMGLFIPHKLLDAYLPVKKPTDKYGVAQLALFVRFASWGNSATGTLMLLAANLGVDYYPFVVQHLCLAPLFLGFFIAFITAGIGFDDKPMYFWLIFTSVYVGYFGLATQLYYL